MGLLAKALLVAYSLASPINAPVCTDDPAYYEPKIRTCAATIQSCQYDQQISLSCEQTEKRIVDVSVAVSLSAYMLKVNGELDDGGTCTFLEQKIIVGKDEWETPSGEFTITHAYTNPFWYPSKKLRDEMAEDISPEYVERTFIHEDGIYMVPGKKNPMGAVKFYFKNRRGAVIHGTPDKHLFRYRRRGFSHGCIRVDDEVGLLKTLNYVVGNTQDCEDDCIDARLKDGETRKVIFNRPIDLVIRE